MRRFARPYAEVLFEEASRVGAEDAVASELRTYAETVAASDELRQIAENPTVSPEDKGRILDAIARAYATSDMVRRFLRVLAANERLHELSAIVEAYQEILDRRRGVAFAEIRTATPLRPETRARLEAALVQAVGRPIRAEVTVDPALRAGFVAKVGSSVFDGSLEGEIRRMHGLLTGGRERGPKGSAERTTR